MAAIHLRFGLPAVLPAELAALIKAADRARRLSRGDTACRLLRRRGARVSSAGRRNSPPRIERDYLTPWPAETAEARYLERFAKLVGE